MESTSVQPCKWDDIAQIISHAIEKLFPFLDSSSIRLMKKLLMHKHFYHVGNWRRSESRNMPWMHNDVDQTHIRNYGQQTNRSAHNIFICSSVPIRQSDAFSKCRLVVVAHNPPCFLVELFPFAASMHAYLASRSDEHQKCPTCSSLWCVLLTSNLICNWKLHVFYLWNRAHLPISFSICLTSFFYLCQNEQQEPESSVKSRKEIIIMERLANVAMNMKCVNVDNAISSMANNIMKILVASVKHVVLPVHLPSDASFVYLFSIAFLSLLHHYDFCPGQIELRC